MEDYKTIFFDKDRISELLERLTQCEQSSAHERRKLWDLIKESKTFTFMFDLELLTSDIRGYVSQIAWRGYTRQEPFEAITGLDKLRVFDVECIMNWYYSSANEYPGTKMYCELLDYLKLLTLEFIFIYRLPDKPEYNMPEIELTKTPSLNEVRLAELIQRLAIYRQLAQDEGAELKQIARAMNIEYTVLDELELLQTYIEAQVILSRGHRYTNQEFKKFINSLRTNRVFNRGTIINWYMAASKYPKIKQYAELLDYIRLLTIEYIEPGWLPSEA